MSFLDDFDLGRVVAMVIALLISVIGHEIMHGAAAYRYGDTTAKEQGRLSLNPLKHIDPIGTIVLPLMLILSNAPILFGWAKPVPVDVHRVLQRGNMAMVVVSLAGVAFNFTLAFLAAQFIELGTEELAFIDLLLMYLVMWNVVLAVFNLLPIPPLDGSNALAFLASAAGYDGLGRFFARFGGMWGMVALVVILMTDLRIPLFWLMNKIIEFMIL